MTRVKYFDYSFLENGSLPVRVLNIVEAITVIRAKEGSRKELYPEIFTRLESVAKVQSVKGSNAIEGIVTSEERVNAIVNQSSPPQSHNELEIAGYRDALDVVHKGFETLDIRERDILRMHEIMLSYTGADGGKYKANDNLIIEVDSDGARRVRFTPTPADETQATMEQLILAYIDARNSSGVNQLLLIPCFILDFLCVHPFADGNGRVSRLLSLLLLYKNGFNAVRYISFEEQINKNKHAYYEALRLSCEGWHENRNNYIPFIQNFVVTLLNCHKELDKRFAAVGTKRVGKRQRVEWTVMNSLLPISKQEICGILPDVSPTTVEAALSLMVRDGHAEKVGSGRSTKYIKKG